MSLGRHFGLHRASFGHQGPIRGPFLTLLLTSLEQIYDLDMVGGTEPQALHLGRRVTSGRPDANVSGDMQLYTCGSYGHDHFNGTQPFLAVLGLGPLQPT